MILTTSWDDGDALDGRVADLLDRHGLRGTFYMTRNHRPHPLSARGIRAIARRHEIGAHTLNHPDLTRLSRRDKRDEIEGGRKWLEDIIGSAVPMFCYPFGRFDADAKSCVAEAGFQGARTIRQFALAPGLDPFAMPTTLQVHPATLRRSNLRDFARFVLAPARERQSILRSACSGWSSLGASIAIGTSPSDLFHLWGHSWEVDQLGMWQELDAFLRLLASFACSPVTNGNSLIGQFAEKPPAASRLGSAAT